MQELWFECRQRDRNVNATAWCAMKLAVPWAQLDFDVAFATASSMKRYSPMQLSIVLGLEFESMTDKEP